MSPPSNIQNQSKDGPNYPFSLAVLQLSPKDYLLLQDALEGIHIFGGLGAGKTSGSGQSLGHAYMRAGFGGTVLCAKPGEVRRWEDLAKATGREKDLIRFGPDHSACFNFIEYEMERGDRGGGSVENTYRIMEEAIEQVSPNKVIGGDMYWRQKRGEVTKNLMTLAAMTGDPLRWTSIAAALHSLPRSPEEVSDPRWRANSHYAQSLAKALERLDENDVSGQLDLEMIDMFASQEFAKLDPEPRSSVVSMVTALADKFLRAPVRDLLMGETTFEPDDTLNGKIILMDMPTSEYGEPGYFVQVLLKNAFQRMALRRTFTPDQRPVFLWADEAHLFTSNFDFVFQTLARESGVATVYLSQSLQNYYHKMGDGSYAAAKALMGAFGLKIFHANADTETNQYASELIGTHKVMSRGYNRGGSYSSSGWNNRTHGENWGESWNENTALRIAPHAFSELRRGGSHGYTEAVLFRSGQTFSSTGTCHLKVKFPLTVQYRKG